MELPKLGWPHFLLAFLACLVVIRLLTLDLQPARHAKVHHRMRRTRHDYPKVFALLTCIDDALASKCFLELRTTGAHFAVDTWIVNCDDFGKSLPDEVLSNVVNNARDFGDLGHRDVNFEIMIL